MRAQASLSTTRNAVNECRGAFSSVAVWHGYPEAFGLAARNSAD
jgi:hypothetical protein